MDKNGNLHAIQDEDAARRAGLVPVDDVDAVRAMNRHQRRTFAALRKRGLSEAQALAAVRR